MKLQKLALFAALSAVISFAQMRSASAELIYALTTQNDIAILDSSDPSILLDGGAIRGLPANSDLEAIDFRPGTGDIYLLDNMENVYTLNPTTFDATIVGTYNPRIPGVSFAFDFNPAFAGPGGPGNPFDRGTFARIITDANNNRVINGNNGQYLGTPDKTPVFYATGDPNEGEDPNIAGIAYTNSVPNATSTQQYGIDSDLGILVTVANNAGTLVTVGSLGVSPLTNELGLDISGDTGIAYANLQAGPNSMLYTVDLSTGAATSIGTFISGDLIRDLTVIPGQFNPFIPEPTTLSLAGLAMVGLLARRRKA